MASMCALKHAHGHSRTHHFKCAEEMPEQNPEDVNSQAGYVWECANTDCLDTSFE